jgi:two-component system, cell cycle response regulator DivK
VPLVLIVEDNEMNRDMLSRRLQRKGWDVCLAVDGPSGISAAAEHMPDIILMDVALGEMDGWEATRAIKSNPATAHIPVVALTAHALESDRKKSVEAGCSEFETKPVDIERLIEKMKLLTD